MKILLTGAGGFIGRNLADKWSNGPHEVIGVTRKDIFGKVGIPVIHEDLSESFTLKEPVDAIVHTAAQNPANGVTMAEYIAGNINTMLNIVGYAKKTGVKKIIYLSSVSVYGKIKDEEIDENTEIINPGNYGLTKYIAEKILDESGIPSVSLRLPGVLGKGSKTPWLSKTAEKMKKNEDVIIYNPHSTFNNMVHVNDLESLLSRFLTFECEGSAKIVLGAREKMSIIEIVNKLKESLCSCSNISIRNSDRNSFSISIKRALELGYDPMPSDKIIKLFGEECWEDIC